MSIKSFIVQAPGANGKGCTRSLNLRIVGQVFYHCPMSTKYLSVYHLPISVIVNGPKTVKLFIEAYIQLKLIKGLTMMYTLWIFSYKLFTFLKYFHANFLGGLNCYCSAGA